MGQNIVLHNTENGSQKFLHASGGEGITCLALSPNKKFLAIGEKSDRARASIHDVQTLKRRKELDKSDVGAKVRRVCLSAFRLFPSDLRSVNFDRG